MTASSPGAGTTEGFRAFAAASALVVPAILLADGPGVLRQLLLGAATALFLGYFARRLAIPPRQILAAVAIATLGELVLSVALGLYQYEHALLPLYVPPGHGVFYLLATVTAQQEALKRRSRQLAWATAVGGTLVALFSLLAHGDTAGLAGWALVCGALLVSRHGLVLASCVVYTSALEWLGTALGNWRWEAQLPLLPLRCGNPPSGVALCYVVLDLLVLLSISNERLAPWWRRQRAPGPPPVAVESGI